MGYHSLLSVLTGNGDFTTGGGVRPCVCEWWVDLLVSHWPWFV